MNVRTLCLSVLYDCEATGYEIRRFCVEGEGSYFIEASFGSIYPALARLEDEGLVQSRIEPQDGKPSRKVYAITEAGRTAFIRSLLEPVGEDVFRSPFLLFARFVHLLPADLVETRINEYLARIIESRKGIEEVLNKSGCTASDTWVASYGRAMMEVAEQHLRSHMHELITLARAEPARKTAAE